MEMGFLGILAIVGVAMLIQHLMMKHSSIGSVFRFFYLAIFSIAIANALWQLFIVGVPEEERMGYIWGVAFSIAMLLAFLYWDKVKSYIWTPWTTEEQVVHGRADFTRREAKQQTKNENQGMTTFQKWLITGLLILVLIIGGSLYWFQYRPTKIKVDCHNQAWIEAHSKLLRLAETDPRYKALAEDKNRFNYRMEDYNFLYQSCLNEHGISK